MKARTKAKKAAKPKLVPPDLERCQAEWKIGCWPDAQHFLNLGPAGWQRCDKLPTWLATEKAAPHGSMSLCQEHRERCEEQMPGACTFEAIVRKAAKR